MNAGQITTPQSNQVVTDQDIDQADLALEEEMAATQAALAQEELITEMLKADEEEDQAPSVATDDSINHINSGSGVV